MIKAGENIFQTIGQRIDVTDGQGGHAVARLARAFGGLAQTALSTAPANQQYIAFFRAKHFRLGEGATKGLQFAAALGVHVQVHFRGTAGMPHLVML